LDASQPHFAFYAWPDGFALLTPDESYIQDNAQDGVPLTGSHDPSGRVERWGKAFLQKLYDDLAKR
jgi:3',5'-cyclic AMP phosphodiesterase CpdA